MGDGQLGGDAILNGDSEPFGPGLDVQRLVLDDGRRAVDVIGEEARDPGVELLHAEARGVLVALVVTHVRRHVFQAAILGELDLRSRQPRLGAIDQVNDLLDLRGDGLRRCKIARCAVCASIRHDRRVRPGEQRA